MKYRTDFVTNSSSSCFITSYLSYDEEGIAKAAKERYGERCPSMLKCLLDNSVPPKLANWILKKTKGIAHNYEGKFEDATPESDECFIPCDLLRNEPDTLEEAFWSAYAEVCSEANWVTSGFEHLICLEKPLSFFLYVMRKRGLIAPASSGDVVKNAFDLTMDEYWKEDEVEDLGNYFEKILDGGEDIFRLLIYAMYAKELFGEKPYLDVNIWEEAWGDGLEISHFYSYCYISARHITTSKIDEFSKHFKMDENDNLLQELCDMSKGEGDITKKHVKRTREFMDNNIDDDLQKHFNDEAYEDEDFDAFFTTLELQLKRDNNDWRIVIE